MYDELSSLIQDEVELKTASLNEKYQWKIPDGAPVMYDRSGSALATNLSLRESLHQAWVSQPSTRCALAAWYVRNWGGVRRTSDFSIKKYVAIQSAEQLPSSMQGIASWSKVAAIANPAKWAIFDARVALALNALQLLRVRRLLQSFAMPPSRNKIIQQAALALRQQAPQVQLVTQSTSNEDYLSYTRILAGFGAQKQQAEMCLFVLAPKLAADILDLSKRRR